MGGRASLPFSISSICIHYCSVHAGCTSSLLAKAALEASMLDEAVEWGAGMGMLRAI